MPEWWQINVGWLFGLIAETYWRLDDQDRARAAAASASQALYAERPSVVFALDGFTGVAESISASGPPGAPARPPLPRPRRSWLSRN